MMVSNDVWVVAETDRDGVRDCTLEAVDEGRRLADGLLGSLVVVALGGLAPDARLARLSGWNIDQIIAVEHPLLERYTTGGYAAALTGLFRDRPAGVVLMSATPFGQDLAPRLAARWGARFFGDCVIARLTAQKELRFVQPTHQEKIYTTFTCPLEGTAVATLRPGAIGVEKVTSPRAARQPEIICWQPKIEADAVRVQVLDEIPGDTKRVDLATAERVVAGGKGVGVKENWQAIEALADALGAAVGGSRQAADLGLIPRSRMIGQTGKSIRPRLYVAAGISGVYHHLGGVNAENLIAINTDRSAPIFASASLGILGDLNEILPRVARRLSQAPRAPRSGSAQPGEAGGPR